MLRFALIVSFFLSSAAFADGLRTVPYVDVTRYTAGPWYEIAANPLPFEKGCVCSRQVLAPRKDGVLNVHNTCNNGTARGPIREVKGTATNDDPRTNAHFTVDFGFPIKGQYWIIALDADYRWAVVTDPSRQSLYLLSKTPELAPALIEKALQEASAQVDITKIVRTPQSGCRYP